MISQIGEPIFAQCEQSIEQHGLGHQSYLGINRLIRKMVFGIDEDRRIAVVILTRLDDDIVKTVARQIFADDALDLRSDLVGLMGARAEVSIIMRSS